MLNDEDGSTAIPLADAEARLVGLLLDGLDVLARLAMAADAATTDSVALDEVQRPACRLVIDERAGLVALGAVQPDGSVRAVQGYALHAVRERLRLLAESGKAEDVARPSQWH
jgi:hypothetical protein